MTSNEIFVRTDDLLPRQHPYLGTDYTYRDAIG